MTLILSFLSTDFSVLISDRRATWITGKKRQWVDQDNKAVILNGELLLGFTGLARLGGRFTDQWIAETLSGVDPADYLPTLAVAAKETIAAMRVPKPLSGHAFIAIGYLPRKSDGIVVPVAFEMSNALTSKYGQWVPSGSWTTRSQMLGHQPFLLGAHGTTPSAPVLTQYAKWVHEYVQRSPGKIVGVVELMMRLLRTVAVADPGVSADASVAILPRAAWPAQHVDVSTNRLVEPLTDLTCYFIPGTADPRAEFHSYGPATVGPGFTVRGLEVRAMKDGFSGPGPGSGPPPTR